MRIFYGCLVLLSLGFSGECTYYNQQQHGNVNYQIDLQDVLVVALLDDLGEDNYDYDYSDLTVKPEHEESTPSFLVPPSTSSPLLANSTVAIWNTEETVANVSSSSETPLLTSLNVNTTSNATETSTTPKPPQKIVVKEPEHPLNTHNFQIPVMIITEATKLKKGYVSSSTIRRKHPESLSVDTEALPKRTCSNGFFLDEKNRCKKVNRKHNNHPRSRPPLPYGLRYAQRPTPAQEEDQS